MNFRRYVQDRRFLLLLYIALMCFVTLMMASMSAGMANILYTHLLCLTTLLIYLIAGYAYRRPGYQEWQELANRQEEIAAAIPVPRTHEQKLYTDAVKQIQHLYTLELQRLHADKRDHQDFIMSWIHEVKLPIAASRLLIENSADKDTDYLVDKFEDELDTIDKYVEQALYYSRIDSFSKDYFITELSLEQLVRDSVKKYAKLFINGQIRPHIDDAQTSVQSDRKWLSFMIDQIVANALKYTCPGDEITFRSEEDTSEKRLLIRDTGIGIKAEDLPRVFAKGFTGATGRSYAKSTGMGLYLAEQMARKLGHRLSIQSEEGAYTQVTIHFPKIRQHEHAV